MSALFSEDFVAALTSLRIEARRVPRGGRHAEHHAREPGSGIEFRDYRAYTPGDDVRLVDWRLYRRFERLFLRLLDEVRDLPCYVLLDTSDSMWLDDARRATAARRVAAVLAAVSLNQLDAVSIHPFGADLGASSGTVEGKRGLHRVLGFLEALEPAGRTDIRTSLEKFGRLPQRHGLVVVVSDFFDDAGLDAVWQAVRALRHRVALVRLVAASDRDPTIDGELRLEDCETGSTVDVTVTDRVLARYRAAVAEFEQGIEQLAARRGATLLEVDVDQPVLPQFAGLFPDGVLRV